MLQKAALFAIAAVIGAVALIYFGQRSLIFPAPATTLDAPPPGYRFVTAQTADGLALRFAYRPPEPGKPTLLFFHGNGDSIAGADVATRALVRSGYGALLAEYRGYGGNPGSLSEDGLYQDAEAAIGWLARQGIAPSEIVLIGNSIGSGPATEIALRHKPAALILISGFASLPAVVSQLFPYLPVRWLSRDRFDNLAKLGRVKSPILILHGEADTLVRPINAQRLANAAPNATLVMIEAAGHELAYGPAAQRPMLDWLDREVGSKQE